MQPTTHMTADQLRHEREELERRAAELGRQEQHLRNGDNSEHTVKVNNWPPFPEGNSCGLQPCFYLNIEEEIPPQFRQLVHHLYYLWVFHVSLMLLNLIGALMLIFKGVYGFIPISFVNTVLFIPFSFFGWYLPGYRAFRSSSSFYFMLFFFIFVIYMIITFFKAWGIGFGTCGLLTAIAVFDGTVSGFIIGMYLFLVAGGFFLAFFVHFLLLVKAHRAYQTTGASFQKAQQELSEGILTRDYIIVSSGTGGNRNSHSQQYDLHNPQNNHSRY